MADTTRLRPAPASAHSPEPAERGGDSMFRNAYALMLSTGVSAALGLGFWLVAARYYTEEAVGQGSAAIAAMRLLASLTATTMIGAVVRYVPRAGRATGPLVWRTYAVSSLVVSVACVVFLATLDRWGPSYAPLRGLTAGLVFTASCVAWALLTLQDGVLTGLRRAFWVPVGNAAFSIGKLLLLAAFATAMPVLGVFVSWAAAIALSVLPLGWLVFRRLIPRQAAADRDREPPRAADIGRFLAGDSVGALFSLAMINLLPVLVAVRFDSAHNAFFYTAYTVGGTMEFMAINMASSLTAHASHSPERLAEGVRGALRRMALLLVPVVLVLVVFAPQILAPFGADYARHGTTVLRLLAAAALPRVVVELYIGVLRVQGRTGMLAALQGSMCVLVLGSALYLLGPGGAGIAGAGLAMLLSMTLVALVAAPGLRAALRSGGGAAIPRGAGPYRAASPRAGSRRTSGASRADADGYGTRWAREAARLRTGTAVAKAPSPDPLPDWSRGSHDTATPAFGLMVPTGAPPAPAPRVDEGRLVTFLWLLLGVSAGLFWAPLLRVGDIGRDRLTGVQLLDVLPPFTVVAGILLIVVQCAAVSLVRPGAALLALGPLITFASLHSAAPLLGVRPDRASGLWHEPLAQSLARVTALDGTGTGTGMGAGAGVGTDTALRVLPVVLQLVCLVLAAVILWALRTDPRLTASAVWLLAVAGWAAQGAFATAAVPVALGLLGVAAGTCALRRHRSHRRARHRDGSGWLK
ncbi:lipopolysaccharide biosynthesis protein [Streptomyces sp. NBC_01429]|uniref:lipopolysaccharide biosynthesis protein n=1 Tax=Streptomyces sp. NBC_01429 TaxID=2903862 RepID=UPI002E28A5A9|nr:lipopolysaccharide biosynthesis protein [Streptomyces sp. NBC_01429]